MSKSKNADDIPKEDAINVLDSNIAATETNEVASVTSNVKNTKHTTSSERQIKFERAQKCLENAALVSKKIKEHRKATAELLGRPFEDDTPDAEMASTVSEKTGYSVATDYSNTLSVEAALSIPGISESLANTLKQKELLMERIKQYKEINKRPIKPVSANITKESSGVLQNKKSSDNTEAIKLTNAIKEKENALSVMQIKIKAMETTILDLQEKINEKDQIIEAKNRATTLISDSLGKKEKDAHKLLEDTKEQMTKMQNNFLAVELEWTAEKQDLLKQLEEKNEKITNLEEANTILENSRFEISIAHSKLSEELESSKNTITEFEEKINELTSSKLKENQEKEEVELEPEKGSLEITNMEELTKKIELLEQINYQIRQTNKDLENQLSIVNLETKPSGKKGSPLPSRKPGRGSKMKSPWSQMSSEALNQETEKKPKSDKSKPDLFLQSLNKDILDKEFIISQKNEMIHKLESINSSKDARIDELESQIELQKQTGSPEMIEVATITEIQEILQSKDIVFGDNSITDINVKDMEKKLKAAQDQIEALTNEIDMANKNMIKVKSSSKLKLKQMQKSIENFSKVSDTHAEIVKLNEEIHQLSQKVAELEEEKGNLQLHLVDYDSGRLTETEIYKKMVEMENLAETRLKSITLLETQKFDLVQELHDMQQKCAEMDDKLADMCQLQNEQVCSEMKSVQLEEQIDQLISSKKELELVIENLKLDKEHFSNSIKVLQEEKEELSHKLESYIQENIELTDKLEKLSAEKVSSAESIEIVESLTTQEKLELEEYNKSVESNDKVSHTEHFSSSDENEKLIIETTELKSKIELFSQERQEVMDKMNKILSENESLHKNVTELKEECGILQENIKMLNEDKKQLQLINEELSHQIDEFKQERIEIVKETVDVIKRPSIDEAIDASVSESQHDDKSSNEKGINRSKSVKQLTKEILKLKNTIKERENEIADCQMKILSLEEQQEKQRDLLQSSESKESMLKKLSDENTLLKKQMSEYKIDNDSQQILSQVQQDNDRLQQDIQKIHQEYKSIINTRDSQIRELENVLLEYEKQVISYVNSLQQKDKEITEYVNQITLLNDVSQKFKSTIDLLESEKARDQNLERGLNKQISMLQKTLLEYEEKIRNFEKDKTQLISLKNKLDSKISNTDAELKTLQESLTEKKARINELEQQHSKQSKEFSTLLIESKERDEEIHQIKLELRKESIENEKLRKTLEQKESEINELRKKYEEAKDQLKTISNNKVSENEQFIAIENKNKELMEKLKKFAASIKKKSAMYVDLEKQLHDCQEQLQIKNTQIEQLLIQVEVIPALKDKLKYAEEEVNQLQAKQKMLHDNYEELLHVQTENTFLKESNTEQSDKILELNERINLLNKDLHTAHSEITVLKSTIESLNNKIVEFEIEQKNNSNLLTKISCLEADVNQKQIQLAELSNKHDNHNEKMSQIQFSHEAKIQERDMYIESLQSELEKFKCRIYRLEESISKMENSRLSLERKADQLDTQLQEKQKAYGEYTNQEDELVSRLAALIEHDKVVEKQLQEIEIENKKLTDKIQNYTEDLQRLSQLHSDLQIKCQMYEKKANKCDTFENEIIDYQTKLRELEMILKKVTNENQVIIAQKKEEFEHFETEFNTQIETTIKDKKMLSEKYEKLSEYSNKLETELQQCRFVIENLKSNINELDLKLFENQKLLEERSDCDKQSSPDYTDQYISEINKLNSVINSKNEEILKLNHKIQSLQTSNLSNHSLMENKYVKLNEKLHISLIEITNVQNTIASLKENNELLHMTLVQKEEQIKQLMENKKVIFEMNIPKTEGMTISSTIEALDTEQEPFDVSSLESQIVTDTEINRQTSESVMQTHDQKIVTVPLEAGPSERIVEPAIVPKKSYLCYKKDEKIDESSHDPFNSEEGWGLESNIESDDITPGMSYLRTQIQQLHETNLLLKNDLEASNNKLLKALKKLKELKSTNEMLTKEIKLSKQISQSSILDMAIEKELSSNVEVLEKKVQELNADLAKERREKDAIKKQNEIFKNANDRLTDMKEKMDNEVELWKYNFKQANDKLSIIQLEGEPKASVTRVVSDIPILAEKKSSGLEDELIKLEKENDELQTMVDNLNAQNKVLSTQEIQFNNEIGNLKRLLKESSLKCDLCDKLKTELAVIQIENSDLLQNYSTYREKLCSLETQHNELKHEKEQLKCSYEENEKIYVNEKSELERKIDELTEEIQTLKVLQSESNSKLTSLNCELDSTKSILENYETRKNQDANSFMFAEKYNSMEEINLNLQKRFDHAIENITQLEIEKTELLQKVKDHENKIDQLNTKINQLNTENDQLLSSVAELRASISTAVDQRGFEIAELWKQHLTQRETEFQSIENDLRKQINTFEAKYEQLLENVQSSSQEETNKIVSAEQLASLQNKLQEKEDHILNLQNKYADTLSQLDMLRSEMEDERLMLENKILVHQEECENVIKELNSRNQQHMIDSGDMNKNLSSEVEAQKIEIMNLNQNIEEIQTRFETEVAELKKQLQHKESEIFQKTHEFTISLTERNEEFENVRKQLLEYEKRIEELTFEKESELALLRLKIHEHGEVSNKIQRDLESDKNMLSEALNEKIVECTNLNRVITDLNKLLKEYADKATETQMVLESQELEIVTLKDEISKLLELKASTSRIEKHVTFSSDTKNIDEENSQSTLNKDLLDAVPKAELDLAMYMLHQRDVRCEELTMELTQLLEERDTLQLRLSDSLRSYEDLKSHTGTNLEQPHIVTPEVMPATPSSSTAIERHIVDTHRGQSSRSSSISDPDGDKPKLQAKLSELRSVKHSRDVRLRHESEQRQIGMRLLHRDVANLPPEAIDQLTQAHHTLSRDSQSTSTVLLNWLRGKSTPKVVHM